MQKLLHRVFWLLCCLGLSLLSNANEHAYRDHQNGFEIAYPESWSVKGQPHSRGIIKADLLSRDQKTGLQIRIFKNNFSAFSEFVVWYSKQFEKDMAQPILLSQQDQNIAGFTGCRMSFDGRKRNGYFLINHLLQDKDRVFVFQSGTPYEQRSVNEPIIDAIAESFSIH